MPHSHGYRKGTRHLFARPFRRHGRPSTHKYLTNYKLGDYVDIVGNGSVHKGMPFKFYHGRTGRVWNVTKSSIGVEVNKQVRNRIIPKRLHVRVEHVQPSRCREDFLKRVRRNDAERKAARVRGTKPLGMKRFPTAPKPGRFVKVPISSAQTFTPLKYEDLI
eukprot:TRINITY_DN125_c0_g1_i1.p1 TRINITY_DN125_c0_g1~~TRINITY_DN125_c0_g1_i1.p1  ORF type:complete len:162 (-),score=34.66 TRINITY_DN125_c0_g1_i1:20-505(-)